jgi:hypothetical protein
MRLRADLRQRMLGVVGVALLVAIAGAVVLTAAAGARRTASTLARVERETRAADLLVNPDANPDPAAWKQVDTLPEVAAVATVLGLGGGPLDANGDLDMGAAYSAIIAANPDGRLFRDVDRPHLLRGRYPHLDRADEILVSEFAAEKFGMRLGDEVRFGFIDMANPTLEEGVPQPSSKITARVTGIVALLDDVSRAADDPKLSPTIILTPAFARQHPIEPAYVGKFVRLRPGASVNDFEQKVGELLDASVNFQERSLTEARARRATRPYVIALSIFAMLAALAAVAVLGQVIARSSRPLRDERRILSAMGMTRGQLALLGGARGGLIGVLAAIMAVIGAVLASPLMPVGPLRKIDPARGFDADFLVLSVGALVLLALCVATGIAAVLLRGHRARNLASVRAGDQLARAGAPVPVVSGVRFALDRGKDGTVPVRSTLLGVAVALTALVATIVFASGLTSFTSSPVRYGWPWAAQINDPEGDGKVLDAALKTLPGRPEVAGVTEGAYSQFDIDERSIAAIGMDTRADVPFLPMLRGRAPVRDDEIVFGAKTLDDLGLHVGGLVDVRAQQAKERTFRIVGIAVFPRFAPYQGSEPTGLGIGAATTLDAIPPDARLGSGFVLVKARPGAQGIGAMLRREIMHDDPIASSEVYDTPQRPNDVLSYDRIAETPLVLVALLGILAIGSTVHLLVTGVRSRRRDVALLKTIGLSRGQALSAVLVQASALILLALAVAVPVGALSGRWLWVETARWLGIADDLPLPLLPIAAITFAALAGAAVLATGPGVLAARVQIATALRSE